MRAPDSCGRVLVKLALLAAAGFVTAAAILLLWPRAQRPVVRRPAATAIQAEFEKISLRGRGWELDGDVAEISGDGERVVLRPVRRASLLRDGKAQVILKCDRLCLHRPTNDMVIEGNVVLETPSGLRLRTRRLRWFDNQRRLVGDAPALMRLGNAAMRVARLSYDANGQRLECGPGVRLATRDSYVSAERLAVLVGERQVSLAGQIRGRLAVDEEGEFLSRGPAAELGRLLSLPARKS